MSELAWPKAPSTDGNSEEATRMWVNFLLDKKLDAAEKADVLRYVAQRVPKDDRALFWQGMRDYIRLAIAWLDAHDVPEGEGHRGELGDLGKRIEEGS